MIASIKKNSTDGSVPYCLDFKLSTSHFKKRYCDCGHNNSTNSSRWSKM